jgi:PAS domain S-box-containing protein
MKSPVQIVVVEDNWHDAELLKATLESAGITCNCVQTETEAEFIKALEGEPDLIISDYTLPAFDGSTAMDIARRLRPDVPFIFLSGTIGEEAAIDAMLGGATDYVLKHSFSRIVPAVQRALNEADERRRRREAEHKLAQTLEQLQNLFDNLDDVFFSFDPRTAKLLQISPACEKVYGLSREEFFLNPGVWRELLHPDDRATVRAAETTLQETGLASFEHRIVRPDGKTRWLHTRLKSATGGDGEVVRIDGVVSDITERRELEAQFFRSQRMDNIGNLASGIAHDLNNVLTPIVLGLQFIRTKVSEPEAVEALDTLEACATKGAEFLRQILMFARGAETQQAIVHVDRLVWNVEGILRQTFPKSIEISTDIPPDLWPVLATSTQLEQVLVNLSLNARDAMPRGGKLSISARNETVTVDGEIRKHVIIEVIDTGVGIPPDDLAKIFDTFFTTKEPGKGTGLGLSTVRAIVEKHGGTASVRSELNRGTTFTITLPAVVSSNVQPEIKGLSTMKAATGHAELILVVEDESAVRDLLRSVLENYGYRVITAADGVDGIATFNAHRSEIKVVISDQEMPRMSGTEMVKQLRESAPDLRLITMSGFMQSSGGPAAVQEILQKPFTPMQLLEAVHRALSL